MANQIIKTFLAVEDIEEHMPVTLDSNGYIKKMTSNTEKPLGVTNESVKEGKACDVLINGIGYVQISAGCDALTHLTVASTGKAKAFSLEEVAETTVVYTLGYTLEGDSAAAYLKTMVNVQAVVIPATATA